MPRLKPNKTAITALELPKQGSEDYQLENCPGLVLRVTAAGAKTFYVLKRLRGGKLVREKIGKFPEISIDQARIRSAELVSSLERGEDPTLARRQIRGAMSVKEAFPLFIEQKRNLRGKPLADRTKSDYGNDFRLYWGDIAEKKMPAVTTEEVERIYRKQGIQTPRSANRSLAMLASFFEWALESRLVPHNPVRQVKKRFAENERERFLSGEELGRFFAALDSINPDARDFFLLSLLTGARRANVQEMKWQEIDFSVSEWHIARTKNGTSQVVALSPEAVAVLSQRRRSVVKYEENAADSPFVFPGRGNTGHLVEPKKAWAKLLSVAQLQDVRLHDLRRTLGSWQTKSGSSLSIIGKSLNHKSIQSTKVYARLDIDPVRSSVERATKAMFDSAGVRLTQVQSNQFSTAISKQIDVRSFVGKTFQDLGNEVVVSAEMSRAIYKYLVKNDYCDDQDCLSPAYFDAKDADAFAPLPESLIRYSVQVYQLCDSFAANARLNS